MPVRMPNWVVRMLLFLGTVAIGPGLSSQILAKDDEPTATTASPQPQDRNAHPAPGRMFVVGRVLDPKGEPVPGAIVAVHARSVVLGRPPYLIRQIPIADARSDRSGWFRIDAPRTSSSRHANFGAVALAPGFGVGWVGLDPDDDQPTVNISLRPEQVIHGRLFDVQGRPVPDVTLSVSSIRREPPPAPAGARSRLDGISYGSWDLNDWPAWPRPVTTDRDGRFTMRGVGRELRTTLAVHHPRFALQEIEIGTDGGSGAKTVTAALAASQIINVRVTYADTGKPVPHAPLRVTASKGRVAAVDGAETDAEGRCRVNSWPADRVYGLLAYAPEGQPYLPARGGINWPKGALEQSIDLSLPRGVLIPGRVTEEGSGKPVPGAVVGFIARGERLNPFGGGVQILTASDGSFRLGAKPGPGHLVIRVPGDDYVLEEIGSQVLNKGQPGGGRIHAHAHIGLELKPGHDLEAVRLAVRRGVAVKGQVIGPDGQPVQEAWIISRIVLGPGYEVWRSWDGRTHGKTRQGRFELHGVAPDIETPVSFLDPVRKLGVTLNLSGKSIALMTLADRTGRVASGATISFSDMATARGPITVRLEPCGAATARILDPDGRPVAGRLPRESLTMVVTPGPPYSNVPDKSGRLFAEEADLSGVNPINYPNGLACDIEGRLTLPVLIPGATYRVTDRTTARTEAGPQLRKEFTVKPGETADLGDILIARPHG